MLKVCLKIKCFSNNLPEKKKDDTQTMTKKYESQKEMCFFFQRPYLTAATNMEMYK